MSEDHEEVARRINEVYNKWGKGPSAAVLEDAKNGRGASSSNWKQAFSEYEVNHTRVERKVKQYSKTRRSGRGRNDGFTEVEVPAYVPHAMTEFPFVSPERRQRFDHNFYGHCCSTKTSSSHKKFKSPTSGHTLGYRDILKVQTPANAHVLTYTFPYLASVLSRSSTGPYPSIGTSVLNTKRVKARIEEVTQDELTTQPGASEQAVRRSVASRAKTMANGLYSCVSMLGYRLNGWFVYHVFRRLLTSLNFHYEEIEMVKKAMEEQVPIVILPTHRSNLDSIIMLFLMFISEMQIPRTIAGDNLNLPIISRIVQNHGSFFMRRRLDKSLDRKDKLYRGILQEHIEQLLLQQQSLMFYIEGSRSRSGRIGAPKCGLLSVLVDAIIDGTVSDIYIVPASITYDRTLETSSYVAELMGEEKKPETFWDALRGLWAMLTGKTIGNVSVHFAQPFSLTEFIRHHLKTDATVAGHGGDESESHESERHESESRESEPDRMRSLVNSLGLHVRRTQQCISTAMSTSIVAFLLLTRFRQGVDMHYLKEAYLWAEQLINARHLTTAWGGEPEAAIRHACVLLSDAVSVTPMEVDDEEPDSEDNMFISPCLELPHVFELSICSTEVTRIFVKEAILACSLHAMNYSSHVLVENTESTIRVLKTELMIVMEELARLLKFEFTLDDPCAKQTSALAAAIDLFMLQGFMVKEAAPAARGYDDDDDDYSGAWGTSRMASEDKYKVEMTAVVSNWIRFLQSVLQPTLELYWVAARQLSLLLDAGMDESAFVSEVLQYARNRLETGVSQFGEVCYTEPIKNAVKAFLEQDILVLQPAEANPASVPLLQLTPHYRSLGAIEEVACKINDYMF